MNEQDIVNAVTAKLTGTPFVVGQRVRVTNKRMPMPPSEVMKQFIGKEATVLVASRPHPFEDCALIQMEYGDDSFNWQWLEPV